MNILYLIHSCATYISGIHRGVTKEEYIISSIHREVIEEENISGIHRQVTKKEKLYISLGQKLGRPTFHNIFLLFVTPLYSIPTCL